MSEHEPTRVDELAEWKRLDETATPVPWMWHTGCSWRRLVRDDRMGDVREVATPTVNQHDAHPDLNIDQMDMELIVAMRNNFRRLIEEVEYLKSRLRMHELAADLPEDIDTVIADVLSRTVSYDASMLQIQQAIVRAQKTTATMETERDSAQRQETYLQRQIEVGRWAMHILQLQPDVIRTDTKERGDGELNEIIPRAYEVGLLKKEKNKG